MRRVRVPPKRTSLVPGLRTGKLREALHGAGRLGNGHVLGVRIECKEGICLSATPVRTILHHVARQPFWQTQQLTLRSIETVAVPSGRLQTLRRPSPEKFLRLKQ